MAESERLFTVAEAVTSPDSPLAGRISVAWLYRRIQHGEFPGVVRAGRKVFVTASGMHAFIAGGGIAATAERIATTSHRTVLRASDFAASGAPDDDCRTSFARALDLAVLWLGGRVPDRIPPDPSFVAFSGPLSDLATEYGRRIHNRFALGASVARLIYQESNLGKLLDELPRLLRQPSLTEARLTEMCRRIEAAERKVGLLK